MLHMRASARCAARSCVRCLTSPAFAAATAVVLVSHASTVRAQPPVLPPPHAKAPVAAVTMRSWVKQDVDDVHDTAQTERDNNLRESLRVGPQAATVADKPDASGAGAAASTPDGVVAPSTAGKADGTDGIRGATSVEPGAAGAAGAGSGAGAGGGAAAGGSAIAGNAPGSTPSQEFHANRDNGLKYTINTKLM